MNIEKIILAAQRAPSGDNCQPWTYKWENERLFIYHDEDRAKHYLNIKNYASLLSLGCVVESIYLAASEQGYSIHCEYFYNSDGAIHKHLAEIQFSRNNKSSPFDKNLYNYISERYTHRDRFIKSDAKTLILKNKEHLTHNLNSVDFFVTEKQSVELTDYLVESDSFIWSKINGLRDLFKGMRFTTKQYEGTKDGMFWKDLGINRMEKSVLQLLSLNPDSIKYLNAIGFRNILKIKMAQNINTSSGFTCITITNNDFLSIINAGRLGMRCWLYLTSEGFSVQPNIGSLYSFFSEQNKMPDDCSDDEKKYFRSGKNILQRQFNTKDQPVWLFRYGIPAQKRKETTIRKPISELILN